jgi:hypothetical protein
MRLTNEIVEALARTAEANGYEHVRRMGPVIRVCGAAIVQVEWGAPETLFSRKVKLARGYLRVGYDHPNRSPREAGGVCIYFMVGHRRGETILRISTLSDAHAFAAQVTGDPQFLRNLLIRHPSRPLGEELAA